MKHGIHGSASTLLENLQLMYMFTRKHTETECFVMPAALIMVIMLIANRLQSKKLRCPLYNH